MCYTIQINLTKNEIEKRFGVKTEITENFQPGYFFSAFSLPRIPVIASESADKLSFYNWGLIPHWIKNEEDANKIRFRTLNAKAETITNKPSFRNPVKSKRCLIPVNGFFEWHEKDKKKYPFFIQLQTKVPFALAGIYDNWLNKDTGELINTFSIITVSANKLMEKIHNTKKRMPVILNPENEQKWIEGSLPVNSVIEFLKPYDDEKLLAFPVSRLVTDRQANKNTPQVSEAFHYPELDLTDLTK